MGFKWASRGGSYHEKVRTSVFMARGGGEKGYICGMKFQNLVRGDSLFVIRRGKHCPYREGANNTTHAEG